MAKEECRDARRHCEGRRRPRTIENANAASGQRGREPARHVSRQFPANYFYVGISRFDVGLIKAIVSPAHIRPVAHKTERGASSRCSMKLAFSRIYCGMSSGRQSAASHLRWGVSSELTRMMDEPRFLLSPHLGEKRRGCRHGFYPIVGLALPSPRYEPIGRLILREMMPGSRFDDAVVSSVLIDDQP